jgi:S-adenosyl-L-methionine hydrolase (adenosine-forming)
VTLPVFLFTDFGSADIYVGQVKGVLHARAPGCAVIDLLNDAPAFDILASAHLLAALTRYLPAPAVVLGVVDPGVGSARGAVALEADGRWFVGPDNGLFSVIRARSESSACFALDWLPAPASASFHGRDVFAPAAAAIASGGTDMHRRGKRQILSVELDAADFTRVIYVDHYGNALTGVRASAFDGRTTMEIKNRVLDHARVFSDVPRGEIFWYENSIGLIEIAANQASAAALLGLAIGDEITLGRV